MFFFSQVEIGLTDKRFSTIKFYRLKMRHHFSYRSFSNMAQIYSLSKGKKSNSLINNRYTKVEGQSRFVGPHHQHHQFSDLTHQP